MNELQKFTESENRTFSSLYLVEQINEFRKQEGNRQNLRHSEMIRKIELEFEDEIHLRKIASMFKISELPNGGQRKDKFYNLTETQALQILASESRIVRKALIKLIIDLKDQNARLQIDLHKSEAQLAEAKMNILQAQNDRLWDKEETRKLYRFK